MRLGRFITGFLLATAVATAGAADYRLTFNKPGVSASTPAHPAPTLSHAAPAQGPTAGGTAFTLTGNHFQPGASVMIGGAPATGVNWTSAFELTALTPAHTWGLADIALVNPDNQSATLFNAFRYIAPAPVVQAATPDSGPDFGGTAVTVTGSGFLDGAQVRFGSLLADDITVASPTQITATTPARSSGTVNVQVTNPDGQVSTLAGGYVYKSSQLVSLTPDTVMESGGAVTLKGAYFDPSTQVLLEGNAISTTYVSATEVQFQAPPHALGTVSVSTQTGGTPSPNALTLIYGASLIEVTINTNQSDYSLRQALIDAEYDVNLPLDVRVTIGSGVTVLSTTTSKAAIDTGALAIGTTVEIVNNGIICGKGGAGGAGQTSTGSRGSDGGAAIRVEGASVTINNANGYIYGGGGGGGGGGGSYNSYNGPQFTLVTNRASGSGGGGGQSCHISSGGGTANSTTTYPGGWSIWQAGSGQPGTQAAQGQPGWPRGQVTHTSTVYIRGGSGGLGGNFGEDGGAGVNGTDSNTSGTQTNYSGGARGKAGKAVHTVSGAATISAGNTSERVKGDVD